MLDINIIIIIIGLQDIKKLVDNQEDESRTYGFSQGEHERLKITDEIPPEKQDRTPGNNACKG